jgi:hypothetical protein
MSGMQLIDGRVRGTHLTEISFSAYSTPHVPTALVYGDSAFLETRSFQSSPANALEFLYRTCTSNMQPFRESTRWGDSILAINTYRFSVAVPKMEGSDADQMSFRLQTLHPDEDEASDFFLRAEIEYQSPAFYLFQFAEFPLAKSDWDLTVKGGVAATLIAGRAALFSFVADRYNILRRGGIAVEDATTIANGIANKEMSLNPNPSNFGYQSASRGYGYGCNGSTMDDAPDVSVKFSEKGTNIVALNGEELRLKGPSITVLQNMPISAYGVHDSVVPIVRDLVFAAAHMCPTLPLTQAI